MKRKLMILGITILLVLTSVVTSYAATETTVTVTPSNEQVKAGETFSVILSANCPDGIGTLETQYSYDKEKLELKSEEVINSSFFNLNLDNGQIMQEGLISVMGTVNEGDIYKITFQVKENVEKNTTIKVTFTETVIGAWNTDAEYKVPAKEVTLTVVEAECEHTYGTDTSNNNGTHSATCSKCNEKRTENCTYKDGKCSVCGYTQPSTGGENKPCEHTYGNGTSNDNGTHSITCSKCNEKRTENCTYKDGKCSVCGYTQPSTGGDKKCEHTYVNGVCTKCNAKQPKDDTTANKEIPKAGLSTILTIGIVAIVIIAVVMFRKNQKYRDIR